MCMEKKRFKKNVHENKRTHAYHFCCISKCLELIDVYKLH